MQFSTLPTAKLIQRLEPPKGKVQMVLDTDAFNEIDDQFAIVYALTSVDELDVKAIYAAPFSNQRAENPAIGMEKSYDEILEILEILKVPSSNFVYKGSTQYLQEAFRPVESDAALDLIEKAMDMNEDEPLYVAALGALTNVASAILMEPGIIEKIVVVWLGGLAHHWHSTREFNLSQDLFASRILFDSGVPFVHIPYNACFHLLTTLPELCKHVEGYTIGDFLIGRFKDYHEDQYAYSKTIWDISTIAYLNNHKWVDSILTHSPILTDQHTWSIDQNRHFIRMGTKVDRDLIFKDLFRKITSINSQ